MPVNPDYAPAETVRLLDESAEHRKCMERYSKPLGNDTRVKVLVGWLCGKGMRTIADELEKDRSGLQSNYINKLVEGDLLYRPSEEEITYAVTPLGQYTVQPGEKDWEEVGIVYALLDRTEEDIIEETADAAQALDLPESQWRKSVHTKKWEQVWEEVKDELGISAMRYEP